MDKELAYLMRRAAEERAAAANSSNGKVRQAHLRMAELYLDRVQSVELQVRGVAAAATAA